MYDFFLASLRKYINISPEEADLLMSKLTVRKVRKKQWLVTPGEPCKTQYLVSQGCFRAYFLHENGNQHITKFASEGWWITDIESFFNGTAATLYVEALEDGEVIPVHNDILEQLYEQVPQLNKYFRLVYQKALVHCSQRVLRTISASATEHYERFLALYPNLEQRIPQYMVASYLGITPEFFSKVKMQVMRKVT